MKYLKELRQLFYEEKKIDPKKINLETNFIDLDIDSLDLLEMIVKAEEKFNFSIPDEKLFDIQTVKDLLTIINELKGI